MRKNIPLLVTSVLLAVLITAIFSNPIENAMYSYGATRSQGSWILIGILSILMIATIIFVSLTFFVGIIKGTNGLWKHVADAYLLRREVVKELRQTMIRDQTSRKIILRSLPNSAAFTLVNWVTALCMFGSFFTTALGFYDAVMDPNDPEWMKYGLSIMLSGLASIIIWTCWNLVYREMRLASTRSGRIKGLLFGIPIVILTLSISTAFGVIGVGGTEAQRIDHRLYVDVLDVAYQMAMAERTAEKAAAIDTQLFLTQFESLASREDSGGSGCGAGRGDLWRFYTARQGELQTVVVLMQMPLDDMGLDSQIETLRADIRNPGMRFELAQANIGMGFKGVSNQISQIWAGSTLSLLQSLDEQLSLVHNDSFFSGWQSCQLGRKNEIQREVEAMQASLERIRKRIEGKTQESRSRLMKSLGNQSRFQGLDQGAVPKFYPLDKFWAVWEHRDQLPGYIALQLGIDLSPAIFAFLFAFLATLALTGTKEALQKGQVLAKDQKDGAKDHEIPRPGGQK